MGLAAHGIHLTLLVCGEADVLQGVGQLLRHQLHTHAYDRLEEPYSLKPDPDLDKNLNPDPADL